MTDPQDQSADDVAVLRAQLAAARKTIRLNQKSMARALGVAQSTLCTWETGIRNMSLGRVAAYARALGGRLVIVWDTDETPVASVSGPSSHRPENPSAGRSSRSPTS